MRDDIIYLRHIAASINRVHRYLANEDGTLSEDVFFNDELRQDGTLRRMESLTDAASHLSDEFKARHPEIPWRQVHDFRNALAHGYLQLDLPRVWITITTSLPVLRAVVDEELGQ